jgi:Terminase RNaseH-like domain
VLVLSRGGAGGAQAPQARYVVGVDLAGSGGDFTAIVVNEVGRQGRERTHAIRFMERSRGTSFIDQVARLRDLTGALSGSVTLAIDATGIGAPVVDHLRAARLPGRLVPVVITGGSEVRELGAARRVPKRDLIGALALALDAGRLRIAAKLRLADALVRELENYRVSLSPGGHDSYAPAGAGHDDLVIAAALSVWVAERERLGGESFGFVAVGPANTGGFWDRGL